VAVGVGRHAGDPAHLHDVALAADLLEQPLGAEAAVRDLVVRRDVRLRVRDGLVDATVTIPRAFASARTPLSAFRSDGLKMIALAPAEMRLRMPAICSAAPPLMFETTTLLTLPLALASALTAQIDSSRQPLPTRVLLTPMTHLPVA